MLVIGVAVTLFFGAYEQVGNTVALWLETGVDRRFGAVAIPMTWFQALNPIFVFALTPFLIARWRRRAEAGHDGPAIGKMAIGSALVGVSYVMLAILAHVADGQPVNWLWLGLFFGVMTLGELYILPVGQIGKASCRERVCQCV